MLHIRRGLQFVDSTEKKTLCQNILKSYVAHRRPSHIFMDFLDRIPEEVRSILLDLCPTIDGDPAMFEEQYYAMRDVLRETQGLFADGTEAQCALHGKACKLYGGRLGVGITCHWAGTVCRDVSSLGCRLGVFGPWSILFFGMCI